jgi:hypothetical protein
MIDQRTRNKFYREREIELNKKAVWFDKRQEAKESLKRAMAYFVVSAVSASTIIGFFS